MTWILLAVHSFHSAVVLVHNSPHASKRLIKQNANYYLPALEFQRFPLAFLPLSRIINETQCTVNRYLRSKGQRLNKTKQNYIKERWRSLFFYKKRRIRSVFGLCRKKKQKKKKPLKWKYFHSSLTISTLLHVAIMRDKALSNEQLHVVRTVPITNHCVWRKTFLCTNIRAAQLPGSASPSGGEEESAGCWMDTSAERTSRCHAHPCLGQWRHSDCMLGLWLHLIDES